MNPNYHNPVAMTFGAGTLSRLPSVVGNRKVVLVTFPEAEGFGLTKRIRDLLGDRLIAVEPDTVPNPDVASLTPMYERFWQQYDAAAARSTPRRH
jgi:alcohol dehydrogenase class IV